MDAEADRFNVISVDKRGKQYCSGAPELGRKRLNPAEPITIYVEADLSGNQWSRVDCKIARKYGGNCFDGHSCVLADLRRYAPGEPVTVEKSPAVKKIVEFSRIGQSCVEGYELDQVKLKFSHGVKSERVSPTEAAFLRVLMSEPGRTCGVAEFGEDPFLGEGKSSKYYNLLAFQIRTKIGLLGGEKNILATVPRQGYKFGSSPQE